MNIDELALYLCIKKSTLYAKVSQSEIPHYKIGHLVRFKKCDIDQWLQKSKKEPIDIEQKARNIIKGSKSIDIDKTINKCIEEAKKGR